VLSFVSLLNWLWSVTTMQKKQASQVHENERLLREAELIRLQQQLQPHFLFNSLNSISALAGRDPEKTRAMVQQLSEFLRGTLKKDDRQKVTLKEELKQIELYFEIEKVRFGSRLSIVLTCSDGCENLMIPPLILQPIVENAIKHGLYGTLDESRIGINITCTEDLIIEVSNPADDSPVAGDGTGFGLSSVKRRLFLLFSRNDLLSTEKKDGRFITRLMIPQQR
jgi:two-component system, LytTR family, sensor kinase